jgi:hypothetical protein
MATFCMVDQKPIPEERERRRSTTCSDECRTRLNEIRREKKDAKVCRHCSKPSTPEERVLFNRWRRETFPQPKKGRPSKKKSEVETDAFTSTEPMQYAGSDMMRRELAEPEEAK